MKCANPACCEHAIVRELPAFEELGGVFLRNDDDALCCECGQEMSGL